VPDAAGKPKIGLVLSGGGARGAYEVGVLRYVREKIQGDTHFDIVTGTSVGAINGAYIAATCERPRAQGRALQRVWSELSVDRVYHFGWQQVRELPRVLFGRDLPKMPHGSRIGGLVDGKFLEQMVRQQIPWRAITENLHRGTLAAFSCTATEIATGISTVFVQTGSGRVPEHWPPVPNEAVVHTAITAAHALASAAIPALFPAVRVGDQMFVDGSLRQNTPLRPAMRLGAKRLLVVGLRHEEQAIERRARLREESQFVYPNAFFLLGKMLNSLMLDKVEADLDRIDRTNRMLDAGIEEFGIDYPARMAKAMGRPRPYEKVHTVLIRPSQDLGKLAWEVVERTRLSQYSGLVARWIRRSVAAEQASGGESDLGSYVLFDPDYVKQVIELGYRDAQAQHQELVELFDR
jgi:NTE family protein